MAIACSTWTMFFFFFNDTATTEIYTLSLHDALPICFLGRRAHGESHARRPGLDDLGRPAGELAAHAGRPRSSSPGDRKSTRLNSSHSQISYAVFCLKKKNNPSIHFVWFKGALPSEG